MPVAKPASEPVLGGAGAEGRRGRLESLTGLRFIAALLVVAHHTLSSAQNLRAPIRIPHTGAIAAAGYVGVTFFFVLSGLVLTWSYDGAGLPRFVGRRLARIYPLHLLTFAATIATATLVLHRPSGGVQLVPSVVLMQTWIPDYHWYLGAQVAWSLSCELAFYLSFPWLFRRISVLTSSQLRLVVAAGVGWLVAVPIFVHAVGGGIRWGAFLVVFPAYRIAEFIIGIVLAVALRRGWRPRFGFAPAALVAVASYAAAAYLSQHGLDHHATLHEDLRLIGNLCALPGIIAVLVAAAGRDADGRPTLFARPGWVRLGLWSFALYLSHYFLVEIFSRHWLRRSPGAWVNIEHEGVILIAVVALSGLLHELVERPAERRIRAKVDAATAVAEVF